MKHLLLTTIAAVLIVGCGPSMSIHDAAAERNIEVVKQHLATGTDVNAKDNVGVTPLDWAITFMHPELADVLQQHGAKHGSIRKAVEFGNIEALKEFLDTGADVNEGKSRGARTP